jgi:hypothetical protein
VRLVFEDLHAHRLCGDAARATAYWGAGWAAISVCMSLLLDSIDIADLRRWAAVDVRVTGGLIHVSHRDAVVILAPLTHDGIVLSDDEEDAVEHLDHIRKAQIIEVACNGKRAAEHRTP